MSRHAKGLLLALIATSSLLGCNKKQEAAPDKATVSDKKEEVPEDFVLNPFLPDQKEIKGVRSNADGGVSELLAGEAADGESAAEGAEAVTLKVDDAGAEPRIVHAYALANGKTEKRVATTSMEVPDQPQPPVRVTFEATPKKEGANTTLSIKATKFELVAQNESDKALAAQASQSLSAAVGLTALVEIKPGGSIGQVGFQAPPNPAGAAVAQNLVPVLSPVLEILLPPLPPTAIGIGAKWTQTVAQEEAGLKVSTLTHYELVAVAGDQLTIKAKIERKAPKQPLPEPPGATMSIEGGGSCEWVIKKSHIAIKASAESATTVKQNIPGRGEAAQTIKTKETLDSAG